MFVEKKIKYDHKQKDLFEILPNPKVCLSSSEFSLVKNTKMQPEKFQRRGHLNQL